MCNSKTKKNYYKMRNHQKVVKIKKCLALKSQEGHTHVYFFKNENYIGSHDLINVINIKTIFQKYNLNNV